MSTVLSTRKQTDLPPIADWLLALAPAHLPNRRTSRYLGDNLCFPVSLLAGRDQELLQSLYKVLTDLLFTIADSATDDAQKWRNIRLWTEQNRLDSLIDEVRELGKASRAIDHAEQLAKSMHDVRGGALSSLLGRLQLLDLAPRDEATLQVLFVLVRDHLKIMRSAFTGLDEPRRDADRQPKSHDVKLIIEKWHCSVVGPKWQERPTRLYVDCRHHGALTECCLESAALDRIFYNLANNACRHAVGDRLDMAIFPTSSSAAACLRFVLSNQVNPEDASYLRSLFPAGHSDGSTDTPAVNLLTLFEPQVTTTGSGFGLTVVADFVAGAFGLQDRTEALRARYVGATFEHNTFYIWFHWPIAQSHHSQKLDDYHRPQESLSEA